METNKARFSCRCRVSRLLLTCAALFTLTASAAWAETKLMPPRDFKMGTSEVVWGITTQPNGTPYTIDFGDGSPVEMGNVVDRSFIATNHTYNASGAFTIELTVGMEVAAVNVNVFNPATLSAFDLRALDVNRAIQDGLRYLWYTQANRTTFDTTDQTNWGSGSSFGPPYAALIVLAFQNHGYLLPNNNTAPTGIFEKYIVQRGLNYVLNALSTLTLSMQRAGDPRVGAIADPDVGLRFSFDPGYSAAVVALPIAASNALNRNVPAGIGDATYVSGQPMRDVLQRLMNGLAFGQNDYFEDAQGNPIPNPGRGGWIYQFSNNTTQQSDGSTVGWDLLALLDAGAAGTVIPGFVKSEFLHALNSGINNDGSFDYRADMNPASNHAVNLAKAGIALQGLFYEGVPETDARVQNALDYITARWNTNGLGQSFLCSNGNNKGCGYGMFNVFKALKLYGIQQLPGIGRPAGPGGIPADDWHADYVDYLVANQLNQTVPTGGGWDFPRMDLSCCDSFNNSLYAGIAELILAPVALIQPDPGHFSQFGLSQLELQNPPHTMHTVAATTESADGQPVPGVTVDFRVISGPNMGTTGQDVTDVNGEATFSYMDMSVGPYPQVDRIQAFVGNLASNVLEKTWFLACDPDSDGDIDRDDLLIIRAANGQNASVPDARDGNGDGVINVLDVRFCSLQCTRPGCATQ